MIQGRWKRGSFRPRRWCSGHRNSGTEWEFHSAVVFLHHHECDVSTTSTSQFSFPVTKPRPHSLALLLPNRNQKKEIKNRYPFYRRKILLKKSFSLCKYFIFKIIYFYVFFKNKSERAFFSLLHIIKKEIEIEKEKRGNKNQPSKIHQLFFSFFFILPLSAFFHPRFIQTDPVSLSLARVASSFRKYYKMQLNFFFLNK